MFYYEDYKDQEFDKMEFMKKEMYERRANLLNKLGRFVHSTIVNEFASILVFSRDEEQKSAIKIMDNLDLYPIDFAAFEEDVELFQDLFEKENGGSYDFNT